ncbi:hypothetical protein ccrud_05080 [Corynebacterium crudilactis]|uniref:Uncharacterized protein n=1 Tax=Corynebacterium crudilactis TaxID=1652495 RepID=A0A172QSL0_9CORY|nr:hypothetical protein ccrud_05080 [Corynebacterium crudilactis]
MILNKEMTIESRKPPLLRIGNSNNATAMSKVATIKPTIAVRLKRPCGKATRKPMGEIIAMVRREKPAARRKAD